MTSVEDYISSKSKLGEIVRLIGKEKGVSRIGRPTIEYIWEMVVNGMSHSDVRKIVYLAASISSLSKKKTISLEAIQHSESILSHNMSSS